MTLLDDIRDDTLSDNVALSSILRKCMVLAAKLKYKPMMDWVSSELNGYKNLKEIPDYRQYVGEIHVNYVIGFSQVTGQQLPYLSSFKNRAEMEESDIQMSIGQLESIKNVEGLRHPLGNQAVALVDHYMNKENPEYDVNVYDAYIPIPTAVVHGVLSTVRNRILQFVLEIEDLIPEQDIMKADIPKGTKDRAAQIFNTTIHNAKNVSLGNEVVNISEVDKQVNVGDLDSLHNFLRSEGFVDADFHELDDALSTLGALEAAQKDEGPIKEWAEKAAKRGFKNAGSIAIQAITQVVIKASLAYAGLG